MIALHPAQVLRSVHGEQPHAGGLTPKTRQSDGVPADHNVDHRQRRRGRTDPRSIRKGESGQGRPSNCSMRPATQIVFDARVLKERQQLAERRAWITLLTVDQHRRAMGATATGQPAGRGHNRRCPQTLRSGQRGKSHGCSRTAGTSSAATYGGTRPRVDWVGVQREIEVGLQAPPAACRSCRWNLLIICLFQPAPGRDARPTRAVPMRSRDSRPGLSGVVARAVGNAPGDHPATSAPQRSRSAARAKPCHPAARSSNSLPQLRLQP